jgi:tRNA pseudouridine32 synthase/23S rRNA pseudouridine746 synthase
MQLLFEDEHLVVLNKPGGLLSVPGRGADKQDCVLTRLQQTHPSALVVHRLDMATSGLMVFALDSDTQRTLSMLFAARSVHKLYLAWVIGQLPLHPNWQSIDLPLMADWPNRPLQKVDPKGKPSLTQWRCLQHHEHENASLVLLQPLTGRSHQLRVHMQAMGHPIWGDALYAPALQSKHGLMLHACELGFTHPCTQVPVQWVCEPPWPKPWLSAD